MPISVRLDKRTERMLEETAKILRTNRSEVIKKSLSEFCSHALKEKRKRPYELIEDLLGKAGSGRGDLSIKSEEILRERFRTKRSKG
jgi:Arc/MetJ-type ribon-helix-helix transcriptional regulator